MVGDSPAAVRDDLFVLEFSGGDAVAEGGDGIFDKLEFGKRAAPAEVADSPAAVFDEGLFLDLVDYLDEVDESSCADDSVSVEDAVAADVSDSPDGLFDNTRVVGLEELDKQGDASLVDDALALNGGS